MYLHSTKLNFWLVFALLFLFVIFNLSSVLKDSFVFQDDVSFLLLVRRDELTTMWIKNYWKKLIDITCINSFDVYQLIIDHSNQLIKRRAHESCTLDGTRLSHFIGSKNSKVERCPWSHRRRHESRRISRRIHKVGKSLLFVTFWLVYFKLVRPMTI